MEDQSHAVQKVPVFDLYFSAFQSLHENEPELVKQGSRVTFLFDANETFYRIAELYNSDERILSYVKTLRALRAQMLSMRGAGNK